MSHHETPLAQEKSSMQSFAMLATPLCRTSGEAQVTSTPHCGHALAVRRKVGKERRACAVFCEPKEQK